MARKRVTYRPGKSQGAFAGAVGLIFVGIGVFVVIPQFGAFGIFWTLIAAGITGMNFYQAFGKSYEGPEIHIEDEGDATDAPGTDRTDAAARLEQLRALYDQHLISREEYEQKRSEILKEL